MALNIRGRRAAAVAVTAAVTALTLLPVLPATAAGYTAAAGPWGTGAALTGADGRQSLIDVRSAADGTVFALWRDQAAGASTWEIRAAVKAAGGDTWSAPHTLLTGVGASAEARLAVTAGGRAVVTWVTGSGTDGSLSALAATWDAAAGGWSAPVTLAAHDGLNMSTPQLAAAADGTLTAVWTQGDQALHFDVMSATLTPGAAAWSAPAPRGGVTSGSVYDLSLAVAPDGAATVAWDAYDFFSGDHVVTTATRTAAGDWSGAAALPGADASAGDVRVTMDAHDVTTVLWLDVTDANTGTGDLKSVTRTSPSGAWGAAQTAAAAVRPSDDSGPLAAPDGDVTYVWTGWSTGAGTPVVQTVTRTAATGAWSAPTTLSTGYVKWQVSAAIGGDGTVQVVWPQVPSIDNGDDNYLQWAVRADDKWTRATALNSAPVPAVPNTDALAGEVAAGPDGRATVVWREARYSGGGTYTSQLWGRSQTLLVRPGITTKATLGGTVRTGSTVTCSAAATGYRATTAWSWLRDGKAVAGATAKTRTLTAGDYAHKVACRATFANAAGSVVSTSAAVTVAAGPALKATKAPAISGTAKVGARLTANHGTWTPAATSYTYQWKRSGVTIGGATRSTYVLAKADKGKKITVKVTARRTAWTNGSATTPAVTAR
ncbi:hypothetical protein [Streptomyces phaeofaciens]|uniref:hypothetical protein n=1 Tax=Streptomyces phaeofaciens TaxID=68254 RepID=UPI001671CB51|nr:hypothetical protein [Streptomyces phaeofaciens]